MRLPESRALSDYDRDSSIRLSSRSFASLARRMQPTLLTMLTDAIAVPSVTLPPMSLMAPTRLKLLNARLDTWAMLKLSLACRRRSRMISISTGASFRVFIRSSLGEVRCIHHDLGTPRDSPVVASVMPVALLYFGWGLVH